MHQKLISNPLYQKAPNYQTQTTHFFPAKYFATQAWLQPAQRATSRPQPAQSTKGCFGCRTSNTCLDWGGAFLQLPYHPTKLPKQQVCTCAPSKQSQHEQHRKTIHSQHTGQHSVGLHRRTSRIPAQPSAPWPPLPTLLSEAFSTEGIPAQNRKRKTATKPAAAATVQTYVQTMSQREANNVLCV